MAGLVESVKQLCGADQKESQPSSTNMSTTSTSDALTIEPTSRVIDGISQKTELQPSAPTTLPTRIDSAGLSPAQADVAMAADAEAGASLNEIMPAKRDS